GFDTHDVSKLITKHLYEQSNHPHIKNGEVYVAYIKNVSIDNEVVDAIGIFKSEIKADFLEMDENGSHLEIILKQGISLDKLDKGCL
ncbi:nucleoid-associated protein, partial [Limosilactobacillus reuteri]|uniref:nucleoid-associated protein n=1 Tax=Limosilactobacillus reuteri TaxID=1598 RepID=UPI00207D1153